MYQDAISILKKINSLGYISYIVGGYPRDLLLNRKSLDIDICTSATPEIIKDFFEVVSDNSKYGSLKIKYNNNLFEITTFRKDYYKDSRYPQIEFVDDLLTDLKRRDFTINTICIDSEGNIIDLLNAKEDLKNKILKTVKDPYISLKEDNIRIIRAIRFKNNLGFKYDPKLEDAISNIKINKISNNLLNKELAKMNEFGKKRMGSDIMQEEIMNIIKDGVITIPKILLYNYKKLNMNEIDLILLIYLIPKNNQEFNPAVISKDLDIPINDVLLNIEHLTELNILKLQNKKIDGIRQERINIDNIYEKLLYLIVNKETEKKEDNNIFSSFETEFGRTLAPMEYEIINSWLDSGYEKELILSALKEAVYNGVFKLNYIDKILYEWNKKGIKTSKDIEKDKEKYTKKKEEKKNYMTTIGLKNMNRFLDYLDEILPDAKCELNYNKDYELLIAVMLSAQTTDKRVNEVTKVLFNKYKSLEELSKANIKDLERIIYPLGTYTKKAKNVKEIAINLLDKGMVPNDRLYLESLSGVGRKTTNVVLSILYNEPCIAVDTHVDRVSKRLGFASKKDDVYKVEKKITKLIPKDRINKAHHQMVLFGRYYCKSQKPLCDTCKMKDICKK